MHLYSSLTHCNSTAAKHVLHADMRLSSRSDNRLPPLYYDGTVRVKKCGTRECPYHRLHVHIWLLKTNAIPASMYASQVWSTPFLKQGKEMDNPVQKWLLTVLKRLLEIRDTTSSWCVIGTYMRECGLEPLQFNWFRATMRLNNSLTQCNSTTPKQVLHADM